MLYNSKYMIKLFYISFILLGALGCHKPPPIDPCEVNPASCDTIGPVTKLDIVWKKLVNPDTSFVLPDLKLISTGLLGNFAPAGNAFLQLHDVDNEGAVKWRWQELSVDHYSSMGYHAGTDHISVQNRGQMALVRGVSGSTAKMHIEPIYAGNPFGHILGDHYYYSWTNENDTVAKLLRSHITDFSTWDTLYTVTKSEVGGARPNVQSYNLWVNPKTGDSMLIFQHRMYNFQIPKPTVDVVAWNMTQRRVEWRYDDIEPRGQSSVRQVFIHADKAYFQGSNTIYCFDLLNGGEILWYKRYISPSRSFGNSNIVYATAEDLVIFKSDGEFLTAVDPITGVQRWEIGNAGTGAYPMTYHDGIVYYTTGGSLYAVRASNGEVMWSERSPSRVSNPIFSGTVAVDPERGLLYACDRKYVMAIRLPE